MVLRTTTQCRTPRPHVSVDTRIFTSRFKSTYEAPYLTSEPLCHTRPLTSMLKLNLMVAPKQCSNAVLLLFPHARSRFTVTIQSIPCKPLNHTPRYSYQPMAFVASRHASLFSSTTLAPARGRAASPLFRSPLLPVAFLWRTLPFFFVSASALTGSPCPLFRPRHRVRHSETYPYVLLASPCL